MRLTVARAIKDGTLPPADHCEACGSVGLPMGPRRRHRSWYVWHHWSSLLKHALDVICLCRSCHGKVHAGSIPEPRTGRIYERPTDWKWAPRAA
jgi:hypothetical protein